MKCHLVRIASQVITVDAAMSVNDAQNAYHFYGFGAEGTLELTESSVRVEGKTFLHTWTRDIPYSELRPNFTSMRSRSPMFPLACGFAILFGVFGLISFGLAATAYEFSGSKFVIGGIFLVAFSSWLTWRLRYRSVLDWIIVPCTIPDQHIVFSRFGPDSDRVDQFTELLRLRIVNSREN